MKKTNETRSVQDYRKFTRELRAQLNLVKMLERQFFGLDDLCEWAIKNEVTCLNRNGGSNERVSVIDDCLGRQQKDCYERMRVEVGNLYDMLMQGRQCFGFDDDAPN